MAEGHEETFRVDGYVQYLDSGVGFTGIYMSKLTKLYALDMWSLLCVNYILTYKMNTMVEKGRVCGVKCIVAAILENTTFLIQQVFQPRVC